MKFQDDISNMNTYVRTYGQAETNMPPHFFKVGGIKSLSKRRAPVLRPTLSSLCQIRHVLLYSVQCFR